MKKLFLLLFVVSLTLCTSDKLTGTTDEQVTGKPLVAGVFFASDGTTPARNTAVYIRNNNKLIDTTDLILGIVQPDTAVTFTDADGRYAIDTIDTGMYVIEGTNGNNRVLIDSVHITDPDSTKTISPDTLKPAGAIKGMVYLSEGGDPRKVFVLAFGIDRFARVNADGTFMFKGLAEGSYDLRIIALLNDYGVVDTFGIPVRTADTTDIDTIRLSYLGIPSPRNLLIRYDTLQEVVLLSWMPADTSRIDGYNIYRANKGQNFTLLTQTPLLKTAVAFSDATVVVGQTYEYRVVSRKSSGEESQLMDVTADTALVASSSLVTPIFKWTLRNTLHDTASISDSVSLILNLANPTRKIDSVYWYNGSYDTPLLTIKDSLLSVTDSLKLAWSTPGDKQVFVRLVDAANIEWLDTIHVHVIQDIPQASILGTDTVTINTPLTFTAQTSQRFGSIVKYRWDNGIAAGYDDSTTDKYTLTYLAETSYAVKLEVIDDDGNVNGATKIITVTNDAPVISGLNDTIININDVITFNVKATDANGIAKCYWDFGDGMPNQYDTTSISTVTHTFPATTKICTTSVMVVDSFGKTSKKSARVSIFEHQGQMVKIIAAGQSFRMGQAWVDDPVHQVTFTNNFWMDTTEVTQKQYRDLMTATYTGYTSPNWRYGTGDNHPAYNINWYDAVLYCNARTKASGNADTVYSYTSISGVPGNGCSLSGLSIDLSVDAYRLPTEAEWEYACRGGTTTEYWWGSENAAGIGARAWSYWNSGNSSNAVATKIANTYRLYDMAGNAFEWCNDWYEDYTADAVTNPTGPATGMYRVLRGGSWISEYDILSSANRARSRPYSRYDYFGFRCVCSRY
jgi:formylglycine-generating enzyme required for sulfatase activity